MITTINSLNSVSFYCDGVIKNHIKCTESNFTLTKEEKDNILSAEKTDTYTSANNSFSNVTTTTNVYTNLMYNNVINLSRQFPYGTMAKNSGFIAYNNVIYQYFSSSKHLCIGDMKDPEDILTISLSTGDTLLVNRNNLDDLTKSISMFVPADQKLIMEEIYTDAKCRGKQVEIEEIKNEVLHSLVL